MTKKQKPEATSYADGGSVGRVAPTGDSGPEITKPAKRVTLEHPKMKGQAQVWEKDIAAWLGKGWQRVESAGNAE